MRKFEQILSEMEKAETMKHYKYRTARNSRRLDKWLNKQNETTEAVKREVAAAKNIKDPEQRKAKIEQIRKKYKIHKESLESKFNSLLTEVNADYETAKKHAQEKREEDLAKKRKSIYSDGDELSDAAIKRELDDLKVDKEEKSKK